MCQFAKPVNIFNYQRSTINFDHPLELEMTFKRKQMIRNAFSAHYVHITEQQHQQQRTVVSEYHIIFINSISVHTN